MRLLRHLFARSARSVYPEASLHRIADAVHAAEQRHTGEICFAVEASLPPMAVLRGVDARSRAQEVFAQLRVWDTHGADRGFQHRAGGIGEGFARFQPRLFADDRDELLAWLRTQPLLHADRELGWAMVHAGLAPKWTVSMAERHAGAWRSARDQPAGAGCGAGWAGCAGVDWLKSTFGAFWICASFSTVKFGLGL